MTLDYLEANPTINKDLHDEINAIIHLLHLMNLFARTCIRVHAYG